MDKVKIFISVLGILIVGIIIAVILNNGGSVKVANGAYDQFAQCIKDSGAKFYGAFWCPHCQAQKKMFGSSVKFLPYIECSTADAKGRTQICIDNDITGYPTWEFADGSRLSGEVELATLAERTSCTLPVVDEVNPIE